MNTAIVNPIPAGIKLERGSHEPDGTYCVMELAAYVSGEEWTDQPVCVPPTIAALMRILNDRAPDARRQDLLPYVTRVIGLPQDEASERRRAYLCADRAARVFAPLALEAANLPGAAAALRALPPVTDMPTAAAARGRCQMAKRIAVDGGANAVAVGGAAAAAAAAAYAYAAAAAAYAAGTAGAADAWDEAFRLLDDLIDA